MEAAESLGAGSEEWALAHSALSKLRLKRAALDAEEGMWLLRAFRAATHVYFGYASFGEYIERLFGLNRRTTEEKLRVARALEALPELAEALRSAKLNWSVVRELSRVAVPETEREWILAACRKTVREVERMVSGLAPGDRPADRRRPESVRHILRFEVGAETLATFREAMKAVQKRSEQRLDDDAALLSMAREVLGGPRDAGRASYQVVVTQCEDCGRGFQHANGDLIELDPAIVEMCHCDAQNVPIAHRRGVTPDAPDGPTANPSKLAQARARAVTDELARTDVGTSAHAGVSDELAREDVSDELAREDVSDELAREDVSDELAREDVSDELAHAGVTDDLAHAGVTDDLAHAGVTDDLAHAGVSDELAREDVTDDLAHAGVTDDLAHAGVTDDLAHAGVTGDLAHAGVTDDLAHAHAHAHAHRGNADELALAARAVHCTEDLAHAATPLGRDAGEVAHAHAQVGSAGALALALAHTHPRVGRGAGVPVAGLKRRRATQDTTPAIRREVFWRDRGRCVVPGCRNATYLDLHHLDLRSEGGGNEPDNLVVLCGAHHGALHRGRLRIDGKVSTGLRVSHADGTAYGFMPSPRLAEASARAFAGLRSLGFSEKTARASLEQALSGAPTNATAETLLRSAVARASCR